MTSLLVLVALLGGAAVGLAVGVLLGRQQAPLRDDSELDAARTELTEVHRALADARVETAHAQSDIAVALAQRDAAIARADETEKGRQAMVDQFKLLSAEVAEQQRKAVESAASQRMQATEQVLAPVAASLKEFQARLTEVEKERIEIATDMRVNLADGKHVFVDSKVPLSAFLDAAGSEDETQKAQHLTQFARHVRTHVDQLSSKQYWKGAESPEFVVLFLPSEEFFSAALDQMPDLYEYAVKKDVVIATPTTLIGMLRAISYGWKQAALADKAAEVFKLGRELHERLGRMGASFDTLGKRLTSAVNAYNDTIGTFDTRVMVSARRFRDLQVSEGELTPVQPVDATVRQTQAPELMARPVPDVAELVEADAEHSAVQQGGLWGEDDLRDQA